jgi:hypothetical protein
MVSSASSRGRERLSAIGDLARSASGCLPGRVRVSAVAAALYAVVLLLPPGAAMASPPNNIVAPAISGNFRQGHELTANSRGGFSRGGSAGACPQHLSPGANATWLTAPHPDAITRFCRLF